jgi:hypothetical protein
MPHRDPINAAGPGFFTRFANRVALWTGKPVIFSLALLTVLIWAATGPIFDFSDTWQLVINTGTTIVTFLMVFLGDPIGAGFVDSLARPGGNATGFMLFEFSIGGKWLELLKQAEADAFTPTAAGF